MSDCTETAIEVRLLCSSILILILTDVAFIRKHECSTKQKVINNNGDIVKCVVNVGVVKDSFKKF